MRRLAWISFEQLCYISATQNRCSPGKSCSMPRENVRKRKAHPKRSIAKPGGDHDLGLWIDYDLCGNIRFAPRRSLSTIL